MDDEKIMVSIFMLTYNQEEYIAQAIKGVLMQETSFKIQLVIGEDCSTDATRQICKYYAGTNPEKIKLLLNEKNIGLIKNYVKTYAACTGKYVAICDGDDYWIDPLKLQKQVEIIEKDSKCSIVYTKNKNLLPNGKEDVVTREFQIKSNFDNLIMNNYIPSVTVLFRNKPLPESMSKWIQIFPYGDWPTYLWVTVGGGNIYFLNEVTAVYRKHASISSHLRKDLSKVGEVNLNIVKQILYDPAFAIKKEIVKKSFIKHKLNLAAIYFNQGRYVKSVEQSFSVLKYEPLKVIQLYPYLIKKRMTKY